ncbi:MAG: aspartate aminotransferase family protein [Lachnospiraceae bacterium]|nr:aspartate aminotransferase family protein [Lachnospiraceae bacterium]
MENKNVKQAEDSLLHVYNRFPVVLDHGKGMYLYDDSGKRYLDFTAGIAVSCLGYAHKKFNRRIKEQIDQLFHTSNLYYNAATAQGAAALKQVSGMDRIFFTNSGAEAMEGALKAARKYAYAKKSGRYEWIAMENSFHGRTLGALSVTGQKAYQTPFEPLIPGVKFAKYNDIKSVKAQVNEKTCAIILEPIQGEGGLNVVDEAFLQEIKKLCDSEDILLIFDEIQCGMGRTGSMFMWQKWNIQPDIMAMAKGIGNGIPVGAFGLSEKVALHSLKPGDHGTTYGGNPLAGAAVQAVIEIMEEENILANVQEMGDYLTEQLDKLVKEKACVIQRKGLGLMQGLELDKPVAEVIQGALEKGFLVISAGHQILRFVPPLILEKSHIMDMIGVLEELL